MPSGVYKRTIAQRKMYSERIMGNKNPSKRLEVIQKIKQTRIKNNSYKHTLKSKQKIKEKRKLQTNYRKPDINKKEYRICQFCNKKFESYKKSSYKYCSKSCSSKNGNFKKGHQSFVNEKSRKKMGRPQRWEKNNNWQGGKSFEPYGLEFNEDLKEVIRNRDRRKCQLCEKTELENKAKLHCHHIDYDKRNNNPNNLISLCTKCHMKTNFNRNYWVNYFKKIGLPPKI